MSAVVTPITQLGAAKNTDANLRERRRDRRQNKKERRRDRRHN